MTLLTPSHHFPSGSILPIQRRQHAVRLAEKSDSYIFEDDYDGDFHLKGVPIPPSLYAESKSSHLCRDVQQDACSRTAHRLHGRNQIRTHYKGETVTAPVSVSASGSIIVAATFNIWLFRFQRYLRLPVYEFASRDIAAPISHYSNFAFCFGRNPLCQADRFARFERYALKIFPYR